MGRTGRRGSDRRIGQRRGSAAMGLGLDRRWGLAWVGELGRWNRSAVRELAGELRDEGDEGGWRAREKKKIDRRAEG